MLHFAPTLIPENFIIKVLKNIGDDCTLPDLYYQFIGKMRDEIPQLLAQKRMQELDLLLEMNRLLIKGMRIDIKEVCSIMGIQLETNYLVDIKDRETLDQLLSLIASSAKGAKDHLDLKDYEDTALRTLRDTITRLQKHGVLSGKKALKKKKGKLIFSYEERVKIILEKRIANKRLSSDRYHIFDRSISELEKILTMHPREFAELDFDLLNPNKKSYTSVSKNPLLCVIEEPSADYSNPKNDLPPPNTKSSGLVKTLLTKQAGGIYLERNQSALPLDKMASEDILTNLCSKVLGIKIDEETRLTIKLLALKSNKS